MTQIFANGNIYNDGILPPGNMGAGGFRSNLLPMLSDVLAELSALAGAGATSTTPLTLPGAPPFGQTIVIQVPVPFALYTFVQGTSRANPALRWWGNVTAVTAINVTVQITATAGAGTAADWVVVAVVSPSAPVYSDTGALNACAVTVAATLPVIPFGYQLRFVPAYPNSGPSTLNLNGTGALPITRADGTPLRGRDLAMVPTFLVATGSAWILVAPAPAPTAEIQAQAANYGVDTGTVNALAVTLTPAPSALIAGQIPLRVKVATTNTGAATLNVNGLGAVAIKLQNGTPIPAALLVAGGVYELCYDGAAFQLLSYNSPIHGFAILTISQVFTVPAGITSIRVLAIGAGGAGGTGQGGPGGRGGGAGNVAVVTLAVTPGQQLQITIGAPAYGTGGTTSVGALISATGGTQSMNWNSPGTGGASGGAAGNDVNTAALAGTSIPTAQFAVFVWSAVSAGAPGIGGGSGPSANGGGGAGGLLLSGATAPTAGSGVSGGGWYGGAGGVGFGAGGGGSETNTTTASLGCAGLVYIEW